VSLSQFVGKISAPVLAKLLEALDLFVYDRWDLRKFQALNAARAKYDHQGVITDVGWTDVIAADPAPAARTGPWLAWEAQQAEQVFSSMLFQSDSTSGAGRYFMSGRVPTPGIAATSTPALGFEFLAAGSQVVIRGHENIKAFRFIAEEGDSVSYTASLFQ
jgi:hypothetical protein